MKKRRQHAAHGLKSRHDIRNPSVALREFQLMLEAVVIEEDDLCLTQELLGDACKELREAYGLNQGQLAREGSFSFADIRAVERRAPTEAAIRYLHGLSGC